MADLISYVQQEFDTIWNTNNLDAVMDRFTEDAVVRTVPALPGAPEQFIGKAQIRGFVQMLMVNFHVASKNFHQDGDHVTWFATRVVNVKVDDAQLPIPQKGKKVNNSALKQTLTESLKNWDRKYALQYIQAMLL